MSKPHTPSYSKKLRHFGRVDTTAPTSPSSRASTTSVNADRFTGLEVPVTVDLEGKRRAMERIRNQPFVSDASEPTFAGAQRWIEECGRQVTLPLNFCGGLIIMRLYRLVTPPTEQTSNCMAAVYSAAAAYDFAFLALGHADDEADMTLIRDGAPTRFVSHPNTRAVDGINLLLSGVSALHETLEAWPLPVVGDDEPLPTGRHQLFSEVMEEMLRALREASFPILLDRAGSGHTSNDMLVSGLRKIKVDTESLQRVEAFTRHRAHTYFMRAVSLATLLAGYSEIEPDLMAVTDEVFRLWSSLGAATDDLQDMFLDFAAGIHSVCTVMAHLCVAEDAALRPTFRRNLPAALLRDQRNRLAELFGVTDSKVDRGALMAFVNEIELRRALETHFEPQATLFVATMGDAVVRFGFSPKLMIEMAAVVSRDPDFSVPEIYLTSLSAIRNEKARGFMNRQAGRFITRNFLERFWPEEEA